MGAGNRCLKDEAATIFSAGLTAVDPATCVERYLRLDDDQLRIGPHIFPLADRPGKILLIGIGKAAAAMARAAEEILGDRIASGLVITKYGHGLPLQRCRVWEAGHPVPDDNGIRATEELLKLLAAAGPDDLVLCLLSGGGSALTPAPVPGVSLTDKQETTRLLLACGATIHEINTLRKHLSRIKGGRLCCNARGARVISLILSDVIGDDLDSIASGPTAPDPSSFADCMTILTRYDLRDRIPPAVRDYLARGCSDRSLETAKPDDPLFTRVDNLIVGSLTDALMAGEQEARRLGYQPLILTSSLQGEAAEAARVICAIASEVRRSGNPIPAPACLLLGGETTVTIKGRGLGGRNMELALAAGLSLAGATNTLLLSAGTDGTDGPTDAAGAFADGGTVERAMALGLSPQQFLADNDSYRFFQQLGDLFVIGPTRTNVMDMQIVLVGD